MGWLRKLLNIKPDKTIQVENKNRVILECLQALRYGPVEIRKAILEANRVKVKDLAATNGISVMSIYNTITGRRRSPKAMELVASALDLSVEEFFPLTKGAPGLHTRGSQPSTLTDGRPLSVSGCV